MGSYFSNLHIKRSDIADISSIKDEVVGYFAERGIMPANSEAADFKVYVYAPENGN